MRKIAFVSSDGRTLTLTSPLNYTHLGLVITLPDGTVFEARAEIGVLTRNIVVRGSSNTEWSDKIQACPDGFNTGGNFVLYLLFLIFSQTVNMCKISSFISGHTLQS